MSQESPEPGANRRALVALAKILLLGPAIAGALEARRRRNEPKSEIGRKVYEARKRRWYEL